MATSRKTHEEWFVGVRFKYEADEMKRRGKWSNAIQWYPSAMSGQRYATSKEQAKKILEWAYRHWNGEKTYNEKGERYETNACGGIGITMVSTKKTDDDLRIVSHILRKRRVTDWEVIEEE